MHISDEVLRTEREKFDFQIDVPELQEIFQEINPPLNFLVFGLGNDSAFWAKYNKGGKTVFLENIMEWQKQVLEKNPDLESYIVSYDTKRDQWKELIDHPEKLEMKDIPRDVRAIKWDIILVDGPMGYKDDVPGRMKSIYEASRLIKPGGHVFVHDTHREVETAYSSKYLYDKNFVRQVSGLARPTKLSHYWIK